MHVSGRIRKEHRRTSFKINAFSFPGSQLQKGLRRDLNVYPYRYHQELQK